MKLFRNSRFLSLMLGTTFAVSLLGNVPAAQAATLSTIQIQAIVNLLRAFNADATTIANVQLSLENTTASTTVATSTTSSNTSGQVVDQNWNTGNGTTTCAVLSTSLHVGSSDERTRGEVSRLQEFLKKNSRIYPEGLVTGYFGEATRKAVERWQSEKGIVSSGDARFSGLGQVGPRTRHEMDKEMEMDCENGDAHLPSDITASSTATSSVSVESNNEASSTATSSVSHESN